MSDGDKITRSFGQRIHSISGLGPNGHNQWGPTVEESGIRNLDGPAAASFYKDFDFETQQSLVDRDLSNVKSLFALFVRKFSFMKNQYTIPDTYGVSFKVDYVEIKDHKHRIAYAGNPKEHL